MILSTWKLEYALHLRITKTVCFRYMRRTVRLLMHFAIPKSILNNQSGPFKLIKTILKSLHVLLGLSSVCNPYPKGSHTKGATKRSIIAYDEIKDRICKE